MRSLDSPLSLVNPDFVHEKHHPISVIHKNVHLVLLLYSRFASHSLCHNAKHPEDTPQ